MRQAFGGLFWTKQYYFLDVNMWLREHGVHPLDSPASVSVRNRHWFHMFNDDVISMPDKWEYPWYAAWDLAFHAVALAGVDRDFAKQQLDLMLKPRYQHPNGQLPAYEWNFSDVNPPVHAWATLFQYRMEQAQRGEGDLDFLKRAFGKLLINFTWWVNRKDRLGKSVFEGGFLGLDNIGVFDRSAELPTGGHLEQADGTAWMAMFCQNMLEIALELAAHDPSYDDLAYKFAEHFLWIGAAMNKVGDDGMWDEEDGFYYDVLRLPDGRASRLKVRSLVGLLPLCATTIIEPWQRERVPRVVKALQTRFRHIPELVGGIHPAGPEHKNAAGRTIAAVVDPDRLRRILSRMLDEQEFLSPYGIRAVSRWHEQHPYVVRVGGKEYQVSYQPAESQSGMFGGNSNWRGPVWFPMNALLIRALFQFHGYYGDSFRVECPTGSGRLMTLLEVAKEISDRLQRIFLRDETGQRPVFGGTEKFQNDPHWRDCIPFYEYFHGDNGAGLGASHQTGWTALVASLAQIFGTVDAHTVLEHGREGIRARHQSVLARERWCRRDRTVMTLEVLADVESVADQAAEIIAAEARAAVKARGRFAVAISGGRTPWVMLRALRALDLPWTDVHVLQVDERIAPVGHAERNLTHLCASLAAGSIQSGADPCHAGGIARPRRGGRALRADPGRHRRLTADPHLVHLGLGADGHTASLVRGDPALGVTDADVALTGKYRGRRRMTLTFPVLTGRGACSG